MQNFDYVTPTRLIFGKGVVEQLPEVMHQYGNRILLTYGGGSIKKIGLYDKVKTLLSDFEIVELSGIQPNPKYDPSVLDGVKLCKKHDVDVILSVGGGSVLDCSKAIAAGAKYDGDPWDLISYKVKAQAALPIVNIIMLDEKTIYNYIDAGLLSVGNIDLPRKVRYRVRKKKKPVRVDKQCHVGRTYDDFREFIATNPDVAIVEMDSVEGRKGARYYSQSISGAAH